MYDFDLYKNTKKVSLIMQTLTHKIFLGCVCDLTFTYDGDCLQGDSIIL